MLLLLTTACGGDAIRLDDAPTSTPTTHPPDIPDEGEIDNGFTSDDPRARSASEIFPSDPFQQGVSSSGSSSDEPPIADEHDIVQVEGATLYAASRRGGLLIADVSKPDQLTVVARKSLQGALPVALHLEKGSRAFVLLNDVERWLPNPSLPRGGETVRGSALLAFDVSKPAETRLIARYDMEGMITASKMAGYNEAIFVVTYQWGSCSRCPEDKATVVTSLSIARATPNVITPIQTQRFSAPSPTYAWAQRVARFSEQFLYLAGASRSWSAFSPDWPSSEIDIIELRRDGFFLVHTGVIIANGQVRYDWQIDETDGSLRVLAEYLNITGVQDRSPTLQTFSPTSHQLLGYGTIGLPTLFQPLKVARFAGTRAYLVPRDVSTHIAIVDLSDPRAPKSSFYATQLQRTLDVKPTSRPNGGSSELATLLGVDASNRLNVSLIDTAGNIASPSRLSSVSLTGPGDTGTLDPDVSSLQMIEGGVVRLFAIPFAHRAVWRSGGCETPTPSAGVQLVEVVSATVPPAPPTESLLTRGLVPLIRSEAPTTIIAAGAFGDPTHLVLSAPRSLTTIDVHDRSSPLVRGHAARWNPAHRMVETADHIATITSDPLTNEPLVALTPKGKSADDSNFVASVSLASLATDPTPVQCGHPNRWFGWDDARLFVGKDGDVVYVIAPSFAYEWPGERESNGPTQHGKVIAAAVDIGTLNPKIVGKVEVPLPDQVSWYGLASSLDRFAFGTLNAHTSSLVMSGDGVVQVGPARDRLVFLSVENVPVPEIVGEPSNKVNRRLHVIDFADPSRPTAQAPLSLRESLGTMPLVVDADGSTVMTTRWVRVREPAAGGLPSQTVKFYVDRIDAGSPSKSAPQELASINVPGSLVTRVADRFVTTGYRRVERAGSGGFCREVLGERARWDGKDCFRIDRHFQLSTLFRPKLRVVQKHAVAPASQLFGNVFASDDRVYVAYRTGFDLYLTNILTPARLSVFGGISDGQLAEVSQVEAGDELVLGVKGTRVAVYSETQGKTLRVYDTQTSPPSLVTEKGPLRGFDYDTTHTLMSHDAVYCAIEGVGLEAVRP